MKNTVSTRREFLRQVVGRTLSVTALASLRAKANQKTEALPPVRAITHGPKFHWFGYYDKLQFDPTGQYVLGMEIDFEHRSPKPDDVIKIGAVDLENGNQWTELGQSRAEVGQFRVRPPVFPVPLAALEPTMANLAENS